MALDPLSKISSVQSLSWIWLFATPWITARQASLSKISWLQLCYYSFYWSMSLFCYQSQSVLITVALEQIFRLGNVSPPTLFFNISWLFWVFCFSIWTLELLCWNPQNNAGILIGITLNLLIKLERTDNIKSANPWTHSISPCNFFLFDFVQSLD